MVLLTRGVVAHSGRLEILQWATELSRLGWVVVARARCESPKRGAMRPELVVRINLGFKICWHTSSHTSCCVSVIPLLERTAIRHTVHLDILVIISCSGRDNHGGLLMVGGPPEMLRWGIWAVRRLPVDERGSRLLPLHRPIPFLVKETTCVVLLFLHT